VWIFPRPSLTSHFCGRIDKCSLITSSSIWCLLEYVSPRQPEKSIGPTGVSGDVSWVHLDVIVALQPPMGVVHASDRARQDVEGHRALYGEIGAGSSKFPRDQKVRRSHKRDRGICDDFTEGGEREIEFRSDRLEEFCVHIHHFRDRAEQIWVSDDQWVGRGRKGPPICSNAVVDDRPGFLGEGIPNHGHSFGQTS
jgi:hypothetical protein